MIRNVPTGDIGFDAILGGGWQLVERMKGRESATILFRGGPGSGKTLLAVDAALALAGALKGDVVAGCVELLPTEYFAQIQSGREDLLLETPFQRQPTVLMLPQEEAVPAWESPRIFCGLLPELDTESPDLVSALESLLAEVMAIGGRPAVVIVDSLIAGYGLGPSTPRQNADAVMKFAAERGFGLVLCEETTDDTPTVWDFAVDTLLALEQRPDGGRRLAVRKHRYGASAVGYHPFAIRGWGQIHAYPNPEVWLNLRRIRSTLETYGWRFFDSHDSPKLRWIKDLTPSINREQRSYFAVVSGPNLEQARRLAYGLMPVERQTVEDLVIELELLWTEPLEYNAHRTRYRTIPIAIGANAAVCELVKFLGQTMFSQDDSRKIGRIIVGDFGATAASFDPAWAEALAVIASLVTHSGMGAPVIVYDHDPQSVLRARADLIIEANPSFPGTVWDVTSHYEGTSESLQWSNERLVGPWPEEIAHLAKLPRFP